MTYGRKNLFKINLHNIFLWFSSLAAKGHEKRGIFLNGGKNMAIKILITFFSNLSMLNKYLKEESSKIKKLVKCGLGYFNKITLNINYL